LRHAADQYLQPRTRPATYASSATRSLFPKNFTDSSSPKIVNLRDCFFYLVKREDFGRYDDEAKKSSVLACYTTSRDATKFARQEIKRVYRRAELDSFEDPDPQDEGYDPYYCAEIMLRNEHLAIETAYVKVEKVRCRTAFSPDDLTDTSDFDDDSDEDEEDDDDFDDQTSDGSSSEDSGDESASGTTPSSRTTTRSTPSAASHCSSTSVSVPESNPQSTTQDSSSGRYSSGNIACPTTIASSEQWSFSAVSNTMPITYYIPWPLDVAEATRIRDRGYMAMEMFGPHQTLPSKNERQQDQRSAADSRNEIAANISMRRRRNDEEIESEDRDESRGNESGRRVRPRINRGRVLSIHDLIS